MSKDMWFRNFEREVNELEDAGLTYDEAAPIADGRARKAVADQLADHADNLRKREKGE